MSKIIHRHEQNHKNLICTSENKFINTYTDMSKIIRTWKQSSLQLVECLKEAQLAALDAP